MTEFFKTITRKSYEILLIAYFGQEKANRIKKSLNWEALLKDDWRAFLQEKNANPGYTENDYLDLIWEADIYGILDLYTLKTV
ncbi:hypothetical protein [Fructobacillus tropaeoli]|uniref:hypothetical protein n=1 Tax=Fructobacillus tropaeoli TaxID=709323 RepID=UPI002D9B8691|nr:unnamed protein product [Fructobacillus tropaeoli]